MIPFALIILNVYRERYTHHNKSIKPEDTGVQPHNSSVQHIGESTQTKVQTSTLSKGGTEFAQWIDHNSQLHQLKHFKP